MIIVRTKNDFEEEFIKIFGKRTLYWAVTSAQFYVDRLSMAKSLEIMKINVVKDIIFHPQESTFLAEILFKTPLSP